MAKVKSLGVEYKIRAKGDWEHIAETARTTKKLIKDTQQGNFMFYDEINLENQILKMYLIPKEEESFTDYKQRFIQTLIGTGFKGKLANFLVRKKVPLSYHLTRNEGESILAVCLEVRAKEYQLIVGASGEYSGRGKEIAEGIKNCIESKGIKCEYETLDKMIEYS